MRIDVKKFLFIGFKGTLQEFFTKSQEIGLVHFIDTRQLKVKEIPQEIQNIANAIKIVKELPVLDQEEPEVFSEVKQMTSKILELKQGIEQLEEKKRMLKLEISRVRVFGDFSLDDVEYLKKNGRRFIQFYFGKKGMSEQELPDEVVFVASENGLDYFIAINQEPKQYPNLVEMKVEDELQSLRRRFADAEKEIHRLEETLKPYSKYNDFLHNALLVKFNKYELETAKSYAEDQAEGKLFAIEGWVPVNKIDALEDYLKNTEVYISEIALNEGEEPPTYLENEGYNRVGEDLVHIYDTPSNTDKDPSLWVLISFAVFFAMIINDGGYGLLFLAGALYYRYKVGRLNKVGTRVWKLLVILFSSCVLWGLFTNSFLGMDISPNSPVRKFSVLNALVEKKAAYHFNAKDQEYKDWVKNYPSIASAKKSQEYLLGASKDKNGQVSYEMVNKFNDSILMELALLVGIVHICLSFARYLRRNWAGLGWIIAIIGSYFYFPSFLGAVTMMNYVFGLNPKELAESGLIMIYAGISAAVILGIIQNKLLGLLEITNIIQILADILSYLRLYALGLAGAIIGQTVNDIAGSLMYVPAVILIIIGHGLNMLLAIIGGVIHGLRLNFIEWYHWSFDGGGKLFTPLKKLETD